MTPAGRVSSCVDCATPIIGDRQRCPACRACHDAQKPLTSAQALVVWLLAVLIAVGIVAFLASVWRSC